MAEATRPRIVACTVCRRAKMRCIPVHEESRCERCQKWDKDCIYESHRYGKNSAATRSMAISSNHYQSDTGLMVYPTPQAGPAVNRSQDTLFSRDIRAPSGAQQSPATACEFEPQAGADLGLAEAVSPLSFVGLAEDVRNLSLEIALDPRRHSPKTVDDAFSVSSQGESFFKYDPISLKILSLPSAELLYSGFFQHFNYLVGAIDPVIYTFPNCRSSSPLLFTVLIAIASRVFKPELTKSLEDHVETILGPALLNCDSSVHTIWALVSIYYWKNTNDKRGYNLIGFATRMASSAEWNHLGGNTVKGLCGSDPSLETDRSERDKLRLWLLLGNLNRSASYFTSRPLSMNPQISKVASRSWLGSESTTYLNGESTSVAGNELNELSRKLYDFVIHTKANEPLAQNDPADYLPSHGQSEDQIFEHLMEEFDEKILAWRDFWGKHYRNFAPPANEHLVYIYQEHIVLYFNSVRLQRLVKKSTPSMWGAAEIAVVITCYNSAIRLLESVVKIGEMQILYYLWDSAHLMTAYSASMLGKILPVFTHIPQISQRKAMAVLVTLATLHAEAASSISLSSSTHEISGEESVASSPLHMQARFLKSVAMKVSSISPHILPITSQEENTRQRYDVTQQLRSPDAGQSFENSALGSDYSPGEYIDMEIDFMAEGFYTDQNSLESIDCLFDEGFAAYEDTLHFPVSNLFSST